MLVALLWLPGIIAGCADKSPLSTFAKFPPVKADPGGLPTYAVGDSFHFSNPDEVWTVHSIDRGLISWRSSRGEEKVTAFDPFLPPLQWSMKNGVSGTERLLEWQGSLFPLQAGKKSVFQSAHHPTSQQNATPFLWKCYVGNSRSVAVLAGTFPAYPVFCRRSDDLTAQYFYAPAINSPLLITTRKRPAPASARELVHFTLADEKRIAATKLPGLPKGWVQASRPAMPQSMQSAIEGFALAQPLPTSGRKNFSPSTVNRAGNPEASHTASSVRQGNKKLSDAPLKNEGRKEGRAQKSKSTAVSQEEGPKTTVALRLDTLKKGRGADERNKEIRKKHAPPQTGGPHIRVPIPAVNQLAIQSAPTLPSNPARSPTVTVEKSNARELSQDAARAFGVQIASFRRAENAARGWSEFAKRLQPLLDGVSRTVEQADLGPADGIFHRLFAGPFPTRTQADILCEAIRKRAADCLVKPIPN